MGVTFNKPKGLKYTDMCIYIDENMKWCTKTGEYPIIEATIYEYLYHIFYALACKGNYFTNFEDYDQFSLYAAARLYIMLRNKYIKQGTVMRGKEVVPVKNTLDYIKNVMPHFRVDYQNQTFAAVFNPEAKHNTNIIEADLKASIRADYQSPLEDDFYETARQIPKIIKKVIKKSPYKNDKLMCRKLYMSCLLTFISDITIPSVFKNKLSKTKKVKDDVASRIYQYNIEAPILWHLDPSLSDYVRLLVTQIKYGFTEEFREIRAANDISDDVVADIMRSAYANYDERGND